MKKRVMGFSLCMLMVTMLVGCGPIPELPEMTEQQEKLVTEYAAGLLIKYDNAYDGGLLTEEALAKAEAKEIEQREKAERQKQLAEEYVAKSEKAKQEKEEKKSKDKKDKEEAKEEPKGPVAIASDSVAEFMGLEEFKLEYTGYETVKSYPSDGGGVFSVDAGNGKDLVVANFNLSNISGKAVEIDMFRSSTKFNLQLADGSIQQSCPTLLLDDFSVYKDNVDAGASSEVVLLFEVNEGSSLSGASIIVNSEKGQGTMGL